MCTCWSSGVQMPHVIWLSRLISEDQCLCPLTEPTSTKPSRYAISAWVPSCDQVKSLTWRKEMFPFKTFVHIYRMQPAKQSAGIYWSSILDVLYNITCNLYFQFFQGTVAQYSCHIITRKKASTVPGLLCRSPTLQTIFLHTGSTQKYHLPYHTWPASERVHSIAPRQPAKAQNNLFFTNIAGFLHKKKKRHLWIIKSVESTMLENYFWQNVLWTCKFIVF